MVYLGTDKSEIDTPALLLNLEIMESNIKKMSKFFQSVTAELRPMIKTRARQLPAHFARLQVPTSCQNQIRIGIKRALE